MPRRSTAATGDGSQGWDDYAPYYDWENARTIGTRDVAFWRRVVADARGPVLELGCGSGRVLVPVSKTSGFVSAEHPGRTRHLRSFLIGIDRSAPMLALARRRTRSVPPSCRPILIRGDIRAIPLRTESVELVIAPYGILQSLLRKPDLSRTLAEAARVLRPRGLFIADLVPDLPKWESYHRQVRLHGRHGDGQVTLVESVRQDRRRGLTTFEEEFVEAGPRAADSSRRARVAARFSLTFRTVPLPEIRRRLDRAGLRVERLLGGYRGQRWTSASETWLICARRR